MSIKLNKKQFEKLGLLHSEIKKIFPNFVGFNGSEDKMDVLGEDENKIEDEINKIDTDLLIDSNETLKKLAKEKLRSLGLTDEEMRIIGLDIGKEIL